MAINLAMNEGLKTSETQLRALQDRGSDRDWEGFYGKYAGVILSFCRKQGLDEFSARDVLQESMILLMSKLPGFTYSASKGRFRNWLLTLVYGKVRDARRRLRRLAEQPWCEFAPSQEALPAGDVGDPQAEEVEAAWKLTLVEEALRRLKRNPRIKPETVAVFEACVLQNMTITAAAEKFGLEENNIYQIKNRLIRRLREEIDDLEQN
ncbi:RNA polymerase sigma factor [Luteolibacter sp. Populi]|uniref:RNA polymerase sigma factor n=1 Tax=Luteolibacter sp. Populi TaxID=3230487 RepID=UPI0034655034